MAADSIEDLVLLIESGLCKTSLENLKTIAKDLNVNNEELIATRRVCKRTIMKIIDEAADEDDESTTELEKKTKLGNIWEQLKRLNAEQLDDDSKKAELKDQDVVKDENITHQISVNGADVVESSGGDVVVEVKADDGTKEEKKSGGNSKIDIIKELTSLKTSMLRKDFKIRGQIGEPGQKDKLTYLNLSNQIAEAKASGYEDREIVNSVIRAMVPSLTLRNVLETIPDLSLPRLETFLQSHFDEKNATELYSQLTSLVQLSDETCYSFIMRCIELRNKVLIASEKSEIPYDKPLVNKLFLRTLEYGITSQFILQEIRPLLRSTSVSDESLVSAITKASTAEKERLSLQNRNQRKHVKVNQVSESKPKTESSELSVLLNAVSDLTKKVSNLQSELRTIKSSQEKNDQVRGYTAEIRKCDYCYQNKKARCYHCFNCGSGDHLARDCDKNLNKKKVTVQEVDE